MSGRTWVMAAFAASALQGATAAELPAKLELAPSSPGAIVMLKTAWWAPAPGMQSAYRLMLSPFDPAEGKLLGGIVPGGVMFEAKKKYLADGYLLTAIKPGRYAFLSYSQQDKWTLCYNAATYQFDVKAGEVVYLGEFDALRERARLTAQTIASGRTSISNSSFADFFDLPEGAPFTPIDEVQLTAARAMLARQAPGVTAPVRAAAFAPAQFGTGSTLFAERRCGGYFVKGIKAKAADGKR